MKHKIRNNSAIDAATRDIIRSARMTDAKIDGLVGNPALFTGVRNRIARDSKPLRKPRFARPVIGYAAAALMIVLAITAGFLLLTPDRDPIVTALEIPDVVPETARPAAASPPRAAIGNSTAGRAFDGEMMSEKPTSKKSLKKVKGKRRPSGSAEPESDFYALSFVGNPGEMLDGGSVLRVEISKSSLFALGANIPLENGPDMLKADLLVGHDGVTRGIRIVD